MEKKSRFELIKIVEAQKEQLTRYETRLRDVVHAYKNLLREKDALEASVNVLTTSSNHVPKSLQKEAAESEADDHTGGNGRNESKKTNKEEGAKNPLKGESVEGKEVLDHPLAVKENEVEGEDQSQLAGKENNSSLQAELDTQQEKVATLSASLATVMQQKSKMEASYQADKKKMMQEHEVKNQEHEQEIEKLKSNLESLQEQLQELKLRMRHEQQAREKEQNNHVLMLRELQMLVSTERSAKEDLEQQLEDAKEQVLLTQRLPGSKTEEYERQISQLQLELQQVKRRLKEAEKVASQPSPLLVQLQNEMSKMKKEHSEAVVKEQKRANEAEERLRIITSLEECRVADLVMSVQAVISQKLTKEFKPVYLDVINESYMHNVPKGSETHFKVVVVSENFNDKPLIQRHRMVNETLKEELATGVHALSIQAKTPGQWESSEKIVTKSPPCLGGSAR